MKKVLILYKFMPQYRVDFFNQLKEELYKKDIELIIIYGKLKNSKKNDEVDLPWAIFRENKEFNFYKYSLLWQPCLDIIKDCDLIIVEQANRLITNYVLMFLSKFMRFKFAFWGHGRNLQSNPNDYKNKFKYLFLRQCDHWFAYTNGVKRFLMEKNVPEDSITVVNNAIDTKTLRKQYVACTETEVSKMKSELGIKSDNIAIYSGGIYNIKRIDVLLEASQKIKEKIKDFHLIVIGAGPEDQKVKTASKKYPWIHYIGPKFGKERVVYFKASSLFLLPGAVGLAILDTFATETPMVTTNDPFHGPEIEYLENNKNGIITNLNVDEYSKNIIDLFNNKEKLIKLKEGCKASFELYTTEKMVENFTNGVLQCLKK